MCYGNENRISTQDMRSIHVFINKFYQQRPMRLCLYQWDHRPLADKFDCSWSSHWASLAAKSVYKFFQLFLKMSIFSREFVYHCIQHNTCNRVGLGQCALYSNIYHHPILVFRAARQNFTYNSNSCCTIFNYLCCVAAWFEKF